MNFGNYKLFYPSGKPKEDLYIDESGQTLTKNSWDTKGDFLVKNGTGIYESYFENGQLQLKGKVENDVKIGTWNSYFENGQQEEEGNYKSGVYHIINSWDSKGKPYVINSSGIYNSFYENGESTLLMSGKIDNSLKEGEWKMFSVNSNISEITNYKKGVKQGIYKSYNNSGKLSSKGNWKDGKQEGKWTWYNPNSTVMCEVGYKNGKKNGTQTWWDDSGVNIIKLEFYEEGDLTGERLYND